MGNALLWELDNILLYEISPKMRQLEAFRAIMLFRTLTLASEMLHNLQPATPRLLADLESSRRFKLFDRVKGRPSSTRVARASCC
jgi:DNA-binding transcriptional LysR family regulator